MFFLSFFLKLTTFVASDNIKCEYPRRKHIAFGYADIRILRLLEGQSSKGDRGLFLIIREKAVRL
jgi:hypothetical protein